MGNKKTNIIEINGKRYDARTGEPLGHHAPADAEPGHQPHGQHAAQPIQVRHRGHQGRAADAMPAKHHAARQAAKAADRHSAQHSRTLMRGAVKKPGPGLKRRIKVQGHTDTLLARPAIEVAPKLSAANLDPRRLKHAARIEKSKLVQRFDRTQAAIAIPVTITESEPPTGIRPPISSPSKPAPARHLPRHPRTTNDLLEHALQHARSHEEKAPAVRKKRRLPAKRITSISAVVFAVVILAGFVTYSNLATVQLKVASAKAGFTASLPNDRPAGYHLSHLNYDTGVIALQFQSNSDQNRSYAITEKPSAWDSETLRDEFLASSGQDYQTVETSGRTLFLYGQNAATWVRGGVWYQVQGNGALSPHQLVQLASSM